MNLKSTIALKIKTFACHSIWSPLDLLCRDARPLHHSDSALDLFFVSCWAHTPFVEGLADLCIIWISHAIYSLFPAGLIRPLFQAWIQQPNDRPFLHGSHQVLCTDTCDRSAPSYRLRLHLAQYGTLCGIVPLGLCVCHLYCGDDNLPHPHCSTLQQIWPPSWGSSQVMALTTSFHNSGVGGPEEQEKTEFDENICSGGTYC